MINKKIWLIPPTTFIMTFLITMNWLVNEDWDSKVLNTIVFVSVFSGIIYVVLKTLVSTSKAISIKIG